MASSDTPSSVYCWEDISLEEEMGSKGERMQFTNGKGLKLSGYFWPAETPKAVILAIHGHGCFLPYEFLSSQGPRKPKVYKGSWVENWNKAGYSVCGIDTQGHGRSEGYCGLRWYFNSFDDLVDDVLQFRREEIPKRDAFKDLPVFACGISMGGCLAVTVLHKSWGDGEFVGGVLLAPMLSLERVSRLPVNRILRPLSFLANLIVPSAMLAKVSENTKFPEIQAEFNADPYTSGGFNTRVRVACEYLRVTEAMAGQMPSMKFDFLAFHSENDGMTDPAGTRALYSKSVAQNKTLTSVDHMWHYLTKEEGNRDVLRSIISWTDGRLAAVSTRA
mmetsp:Transcript_28713/g.80827  ORF Transcript_28713/g.80827 Transcript_28713/m.80827 type:complete len:332 (-) Transcript_28713:169-1164(-)